MWVRQYRAKLILRTSRETWPIEPRSGSAPRGWPGWPDGKRFAVILTHDVEAATGIKNIASVIEVEASFGFRSSFNLVASDPSVTPAIRSLIADSGCEVGIHGWKHDGKLFFSKARFLEGAVSIRSAMSDWQAVGFRSPFMHRNLTWIHELGVEYDCSTFDSDPFEPEPDGVQTIFPYWVGDGKAGGYVELPYTLVQDFTLFKVLEEADIAVWKRKIDWIAARGGMVLVNTHPDYMSADGADNEKQYPMDRYKEFLQYLRNAYAGQFWDALPRDAAKYYRDAIPPRLRNSRKRICMVTYSNYETDNRVRRYAEALAQRGDQVDVVAIETGDTALAQRTVAEGVELFTVQRRRHNETNHWTYLYRLVKFLLKSALFVRRQQRRCRYDVVHVHNIPDFMVFSAWFAKRQGAAVILDIHDIVPELFGNKFQTSLSRAYVRILKWVEQVSAQFADHVIIANHLWYETVTSRSVSRERCSVFINNVDKSVFYRRPRTRAQGTFVMLFHGTFQWHQGIEVAIDALPIVLGHVKGVELHLYGGGAGGKRTVERLAERARKNGVGGSVRFFAGVPLQSIPEIVANADIGIVPKRADSFGNEAYSTKIMEFMSQGVPVVASRTKVDSYYFNEETVEFFESGSPEDMARAIVSVITNEELRARLVSNGLRYVDDHCWDAVQEKYYNLVDGLQLASGR